MNYKEIRIVNQPMKPIKMALVPGINQKQISKITNIMLTVED